MKSIQCRENYSLIDLWHLYDDYMEKIELKNKIEEKKTTKKVN